MTAADVPTWAGVEGFCPMGCGRTLFLADGGYVTCSYLGCPRRDAVAGLLASSETEHIVAFNAAGTYAIQHPLRERLEGELFDCPLHGHLAARDGPPVRPGRYRAILAMQHRRGDTGPPALDIKWWPL